MHTTIQKIHCRFVFDLLKLQFIILFLLCSLFSYGQSVDSSATVQKQSLQYVKIEIGMHILDCPVLPPQLKEKLMTLKGIKDYTVDLKSESILFNIPEGVVTREDIKAIAARCGFPEKSVTILMDSKPFVN